MSAKVLARQAQKGGFAGRPQPADLPPLPPAMNDAERNEMMRNAGNTSAGPEGQAVYTEDQVSTLMDQMEQHFRNQYVTVVDELVYENNDLRERIAVIEDQRTRSGTEVQHLIAGKEEARNLANQEGQEVLYELVDYLMSKYEDEAIEAKSEASKLAGIATALRKEVAVLEQEKKDLEENTLREFAVNMENEAMRKMEHEYKKIRMALAGKEKEVKEAAIEHNKERLTLEKIIESMTKEHNEKYQSIRDENWALERNLDKARAEYDRELRDVIASRDKLERDFQQRLVEAGENLAHVKGKLESFQLRFDQLKVEKKILHEELDRAQAVNASAVTQDKVEELQRQVQAWREKYEKEHEVREREREESFFRERHLKDIALEERTSKKEELAEAARVIEQLKNSRQQEVSQVAEEIQTDNHARLQKEKEIMLFHFEDVRSFHVERALDRAEIFRWQGHVRKLEKQFEKSMAEAQRRVQAAESGVVNATGSPAAGRDSDTSPRRRRRKGGEDDDRSASPVKETPRARKAREELEKERAEERRIIKQLTQIVQNLEANKADTEAKLQAQEAEMAALRKHTGEMAKHSQMTSAQLAVAQQQRTDALKKLDSFHAELLQGQSPSTTSSNRPSAHARPGHSDGVRIATKPRSQPTIPTSPITTSPQSHPQSEAHKVRRSPSRSPPGPPVPPRSEEHMSMRQRLTRRLTETAPSGRSPTTGATQRQGPAPEQ